MYSLDNGPMIYVITNFLNPEPIYKAMAGLSALGSVFFWLFPLFFAVRLLRESHGLSVKAAVGKALGETTGSIKFYLIYSTFGLLFFGAIFHVADLFRHLGGVPAIEQSLHSFRSEMIQTPQQNNDWLEAAIKGAADLGNTLTVPLFYLLYNIVSVIYVFIKHLMMFLFALGFALCYAWGFVAIASNALPDSMKLMGGFVKTFMGLAVWAVIEPIAMRFIWLMQQTAEATLLSAYAGGLGTTAINVWTVFACVLLTVVAMVLIMLPFLAFRLASNQGLTDVLGMGGAAAGFLLGNQVAGTVAKAGAQGADLAGGLMPNSEGSRRRDMMFQSVSDPVSSVMNADLVSKVGGAFNSANSGLGNLVDSDQDKGGVGMNRSSDVGRQENQSGDGLGNVVMDNSQTTESAGVGMPKSDSAQQVESVGDIKSASTTTGDGTETPSATSEVTPADNLGDTTQTNVPSDVASSQASGQSHNNEPEKTKGASSIRDTLGDITDGVNDTQENHDDNRRK